MKKAMLIVWIVLLSVATALAQEGIRAMPDDECCLAVEEKPTEIYIVFTSLIPGYCEHDWMNGIEEKGGFSTYEHYMSLFFYRFKSPADKKLKYRFVHEQPYDPEDKAFVNHSTRMEDRSLLNNVNWIDWDVFIAGATQAQFEAKMKEIINSQKIYMINRKYMNGDAMIVVEAEYWPESPPFDRVIVTPKDNTNSPRINPE